MIRTLCIVLFFKHSWNSFISDLQEDIQLLKYMEMDVYHFSISWLRIFPSKLNCKWIDNGFKHQIIVYNKTLLNPFFISDLQEDIQLLKYIEMDVYHFSISWLRIFPSKLNCKWIDNGFKY